MQITFDPHSPEDRATLARLLATVGTYTPDDMLREQFDAVVADIAGNVFEPAQPDTPDAPAEPDTATDIHGMTHDATIHSTPASKNADGSWRAKRGQKEAYDAAIAARTAATDAPTSMPMPASEAPATPPAPIEYKTMAARFVAKMADPDGLPSDYETIYAALSIGFDDLETNQTSIARLDAYMDAVDNGDDHDACVRHALGSV